MRRGPPIQDGRSYICGRRSLSLSMIREDYVTAPVGQKLLSVKFGRAQRRIRSSHKAANHVVRIEEKSGDCPVRSYAVNVWTLTGTRARARNIECSNDAFLIPKEAVVRIDPVIVESCDLPTWADCEGKRTWADFSTRHIECGKAAIPIPKETVTYEGRVSVPSRDRPVRV